ncbi:unnamed protein product [Leuciscus chuanchicus]
MREDQQMWLLVTHRNMIVSSMLLLAHTHARTHTLMPQDPFPDPPFLWRCRKHLPFFCTGPLALLYATGAPGTLVSPCSGGGIVLRVDGMANVMPAGMRKKPTMPHSVHNGPLGTAMLLDDIMSSSLGFISAGSASVHGFEGENERSNLTGDTSLMNDRKTQAAMWSTDNSASYQQASLTNVLLVLTDIWPFWGATLSDGDRHVVCVSCLGEEHAVLALADGGCPHCELMTMATLRTRLAFFETAPPPAAVSRRKKRRAQRVPEPSPSRQSSPVRPLASPASSASLPDGQRPPSAAASVDIADEEALLGEEDSCSILASGNEDWAGSEDPTPPARTSSGKRATIETELMRVLAQAAASLGLEWSSPEQPAHNRLDGFFLPGERASPASRPAPFLPELHEEVAKSWSAPYSAGVRPAVSLAFSAVDDAKNKGYLSLPPVEEAIAAHLCPPSAGRRAKSALPS